MKTIKTLIILVSYLTNGFLFCQETAFKKFPIQVSFVYPIGTHGTQSINYKYDLSLNILTGITGSINGFEIGGLLNTNTGNLSGAQVSGLGNSTRGNVTGIQLGGLYSIADSLNGVQINGIFSKCGASEGLQISGIVNLSLSSNSSIGGIANINTGSQKGIQIAGIFNQAKNLNGVQIGLINRADTISNGVSIGLINLIKKGFYNEWAFSIADYLNLGISYKLGVKQLYTIYTVGMNLMEDKLWVTGLGFGHINEVSPRFTIQPEIVLYNYYPMDFRRRIRDTFVGHFKLGLVHNINENIAFSFAPSVYLSWKSNEGIYERYGYEQSPINPLFDVDRLQSRTRLGFGFGISFGLILRLNTIFTSPN